MKHLALWLWWLPTMAWAILPGAYPGSCSEALGKTCSVPTLQASSSLYNTASQAFLSTAVIKTDYHSGWFLPAFGRSFLQMVYPFKALTVSSHVQTNGYHNYRQWSAGFGLSRRLGPHLALGTDINYEGLQLPDQQIIPSSLTLGFGLVASPTPQLQLGLYTYNISFSRFFNSQQHERLPTLFLMGMAYSFQHKVQLRLDISKQLQQALLIGGGLEWKIVDWLYARGGLYWQEDSINPSFGAGFCIKQVQINISSVLDFKTGISLSCGLAYVFSKKNE